MAKVKVSSREERARHGGFSFTPVPQELVVDEDDLRALKENVNLIVEDIPEEEEDLTARELIEKIKAMTDASALGELFKGETRVTVKDALKARIKELKAATR